MQLTENQVDIETGVLALNYSTIYIHLIEIES
jgi:hypothetical protein